jgi:hypothetical protein
MAVVSLGAATLAEKVWSGPNFAYLCERRWGVLDADRVLPPSSLRKIRFNSCGSLTFPNKNLKIQARHPPRPYDHPSLFKLIFTHIFGRTLGVRILSPEGA